MQSNKISVATWDVCAVKGKDLDKNYIYLFTKVYSVGLNTFDVQ